MCVAIEDFFNDVWAHSSTIKTPSYDFVYLVGLCSEFNFNDLKSFPCLPVEQSFSSRLYC